MANESDEQVRAFISGYQPKDEARIRFAWNGQHGDGFVDANQEFRYAVRKVVLDDLEAAPIELVRDLFRADTQCSKEAWCIDRNVGRLGERLLRDGEDRFIGDYLEGKGQSFDASLGAGAFPVDLQLAEHLLAVVRERLKTEDDENRAKLWKSGEETFGRWAEGCREKPPGA